MQANLFFQIPSLQIHLLTKFEDFHKIKYPYLFVSHGGGLCEQLIPQYLL